MNWTENNRPIIALAPMADMTDSAFCRIAKRHGCRIVFREMVSAEALVRESSRTRQMIEFEEEERPIVIQLFGSDPAVMAEATRIADRELQPDAFDINMGCPAHKITGSFNGASLMRNPKLATKIVRSMKAATDRPVSVKTRLGWNDPQEILDFAPVLEQAGADLLSVHGRTKAQGYAGQADWKMIARVRERTELPLLANGDVFSPEDALRALETTGSDGLLIARGSLGNPWIFGQVEGALSGRPITPVSTDELHRTVLEHARLHAELYGGERPLVTFRKHLTWYFRGFPGVKSLREKLVQVETLTDLESCLENL